MKLKNNISFESIIRSFEELYNKSYNALELAELILCYNQQLPLEKFAKLSDHRRMREVRLGLEEGVDISPYAANEFDWLQREEIFEGLSHRLDVSMYAYPDFDSRQMREIRLGLESDIDVSRYAYPDCDWQEMREIRLSLEKRDCKT